MLKLNGANTTMKMQRTWKQKQSIPTQRVYVTNLITSLMHFLDPPATCIYSLLWNFIVFIPTFGITVLDFSLSWLYFPALQVDWKLVENFFCLWHRFLNMGAFNLHFLISTKTHMHTCTYKKLMPIVWVNNNYS